MQRAIAWAALADAFPSPLFSVNDLSPCLGEMFRLGEKGSELVDRASTEKLVASLQSVRNGEALDLPPVSVKFSEWWAPEPLTTEDEMLEALKTLGSPGLWSKWHGEMFAQFALKSARLQVKRHFVVSETASDGCHQEKPAGISGTAAASRAAVGRIAEDMERRAVNL